MEQLAFFNLQRERLKHGSREPDLHHIMFTADRKQESTWYLLLDVCSSSGGKTGKLGHDTFLGFCGYLLFIPFTEEYTLVSLLKCITYAMARLCVPTLSALL